MRDVNETEVKLLLKHDADVHLEDNDNETALYYAFRYADFKILERIIN